jgi:DNA-directed RNA polymerase subunit RPC12/RpoP
MLRKTSEAVRPYLERAANARERTLAAAATDPETRRFYLAMESKWMDLAASTAVVERVDLFLQTREFRLRLSPSDLCPDCNERMLLKAVQSTPEVEEHIFRCLRCGSEHTRRVGTDGLQD